MSRGRSSSVWPRTPSLKGRTDATERRVDFAEGLWARVTAGHGLPALCARFEKDRDDDRSILAKALADRLAEASAERVHELAREAWGFGRSESLSPEDLIRERDRGVRPAPGYPACPDHAEKRTLFALLEAPANAGITLTESLAMFPGSLRQ